MSNLGLKGAYRTSDSRYRLMEDATKDLVDWARRTRAEAASPFEAARKIAGRLGAHKTADHAELGFWAPALAREKIPTEDVVLELFTPLAPVDLRATSQRLRFRRERLPDTVLCDPALWETQLTHRVTVVPRDGDGLSPAPRREDELRLIEPA